MSLDNSLAFMTFSRLDGGFFELMFNVCLINELKKGRQSVKCMEAGHHFSADLQFRYCSSHWNS